MFRRQKSGVLASSIGGGQYSRLDQHDEEDDPTMDTELLLHHPNSVLVANHHGACHIVPLLSSPSSTTTVALAVPPSPTTNASPPHSPRTSFSAKTHATRRFLEHKFPIVFRNKSTSAASFSSLPAVIIADLQNGNIPDLEHKKEEAIVGSKLGEQGWNIIHRRRFRGKHGIGETRHPSSSNHHEVVSSSSSQQQQQQPVLDEEIDPSDQVTCSVFVKWQQDEKDGNDITNKRPYTMTMSPVYEGIRIQDDLDDRNFPDPIPETEESFNEIVESVRIAIESNMQPTRISQGSSGSYFCRNSSGKIVGVFKPKNEEPYGRLNPKWTKWIHRHLFPCFFGRSCLIPNLGYLSEAAASLIDRRLGTMIVPYTDVIHLTSSSFHYDYLDRKKKPPKIGSFQCFLTDYKDATVFFRQYPLVMSSFDYDENGNGSKKSSWGTCLGGEANHQDHLHDDHHDHDDEDEDDHHYDEEEDSDHTRVTATTLSQQQQQHHYPPQSRSTTPSSPLNPQQKQKKYIDNTNQQFKWSRPLLTQFRREFEQLIILDYLIRNTDRGLDNWMIKYCPPNTKGINKKTSTHLHTHSSSNSSLSTVEQPLDTTYHTKQRGHIHVAAIDNGLAFPYKHPDQWRSYPYGWMAMPDSLVNRPFSEATRTQFLSILSDPLWWRDTVREMRSLFEMDDDFDEKMFQKQMAVLKGQGYNIIRTLKDPSAGPVDLVAMQRVVINQEEILIEYDEDMLKSRDLHQTSKRIRTQRSTSFDVISTLHEEEDDEEEELDQRVQQLKKLAKQQKQSRRWQDKLKNTMDLGGRGLFGGGGGSDNKKKNKNNKKKKNNRKKLNQYRAFDSDGDISDYDTDEEEEQAHELKRVTIIIETIQVVKSRTYFTCC